MILKRQTRGGFAVFVVVRKENKPWLLHEMILFKRIEEEILCLVARRAKRQPVFRLAFSHNVQRRLDGDRVDFAE